MTRLKSRSKPKSSCRLSAVGQLSRPAAFWHAHQYVLPANCLRSTMPECSHLSDRCNSELAGRAIHTTWQMPPFRLLADSVGNESVICRTSMARQNLGHAGHELLKLQWCVAGMIAQDDLDECHNAIAKLFPAQIGLVVSVRPPPSFLVGRSQAAAARCWVLAICAATCQGSRSSSSLIR